MKRIDKPWGYEELLEHNDKYVMKKLFMKTGHKCSLQYHNIKKETFIVLSGKMLFTFGKTQDTTTQRQVDVGEYFTINPGEVHRMESLEDCTYLECSTPELSDVVRLEDSYGR